MKACDPQTLNVSQKRVFITLVGGKNLGELGLKIRSLKSHAITISIQSTRKGKP